MSHFEDIEPLFWGEGPKSPAGCVVFAVIVLIACIWAASADHDSEELCKKHGEKYLDSQSKYTLCEKNDGTVVHR